MKVGEMCAETPFPDFTSSEITHRCHDELLGVLSIYLPHRASLVALIAAPQDVRHDSQAGY